MTASNRYGAQHVRGQLRAALALVRKDLLFEKVSRRMVIIWGGLSSLGLLLSRFESDLTLPFSGGPFEVSPASQLSLLLLFSTTLIVPVVVFMFLIQTEKTCGSFAIYRTLPINCHTLYWSRVLSSLILTAACVLIVYLFYGFFLAAGLISRDALTPVLLGLSFLYLLFSLSLFSSVTAIGLAFNISPQLLPSVVTVVSILIVTSPFIFTVRVAGFNGQDAVVTYLARYGVFGGISVALLSVSILVGGLASVFFKLKRSYV
ncbi:MAG TPA: hypothetical protein VE262_08045 [Blastocatellia bacterium]|nr:hypothetical protein [Blastocatellia bacterium]